MTTKTEAPAVPEEKQLQHGDEQCEEERTWVADDVQELFPADGDETMEKFSHCCDSVFLALGACASMMR